MTARLPQQLMFVRKTSMPSLRRIAQAASLGIILLCERAGATFSIVAVDTNNGEMGAVVVSCVGSDFDLSEVVRLHPDVGAIVTQSYFYAQGRDLIFTEMQEGSLPTSAIAAALDPLFDPAESGTGPTFRQYAAINLTGAIGTHTGRDCMPFAGQLSGHEGTVAFVVSGNILTGQEALTTLQSAFLQAKGGIGNRLVEGLRAVGLLGKGDARCSPLSGDAGYFELYIPSEDASSALEPAVQLEALSKESDVALLLADRAERALAARDPSPLSQEPQEEASNSTSGCALSERLPSGASALLITLALGLMLGRRRFLDGTRSLTSKDS